MAKDRHGLVVGGTRGLGRELTHVFVEEGRRVSVVARRLPAAGDRLPTVEYFSGDVTKVEVVPSLLEQVAFRNGKLNDLVFLLRYRGAGDPWTGELETSLTAARTTIEASLPWFEAGDASIVIVSSVNARLISDHLPVSYHVAKAGLVQMARYYAVKLGRNGVRVNSVSPGTMAKEEAAEFYRQNSELTDLYCRIVPLGRMGTARETADVIAFLCSTKASFVTGQDIVVDGGACLPWQGVVAAKLRRPAGDDDS